MSTISLTLNEQELIKVQNLLKSHEVDVADNNIKHTFKLPVGRVTIYCTNVMVIQGNDAKNIYKKIFNKEYMDVDKSGPMKKTEIGSQYNQNLMNSIGSDEVGVGDFFGGLIVSAAYVEKDQIEWLKSIGVTDSKLLTNEKILELYSLLKKEIKHTVVIASPADYNQMFEDYQNAHVIKAVMHNQALTKLTSKIEDKYFIVIDEFASRENYAKYLRQAKVDSIKIDLSLTKAESQFLCVACASIIARAFFLKQINTLSNELQIHLPLGSSNTIIPTVGKKIIAKVGIENFANYCKKHFITYNKITGE